MPWADFAVCLRLQVRKFRCLRKDCEQQVFCERLPPEVVSAWARKTDRLLEQQRQIALSLGSKPGARLSEQLHRPTSATSLLRLIRAIPSPAAPTPRVLGVDDFAKRKGQRYGTVLVDLERQAPIELLPDRDAGTLAAWLEAHPGVEIIARDRAGAYADGARQGAPQALQVADRFHLIRNLANVLLQVFENESHALREKQPSATKPETPAPLIDPAVVSTHNDQTDDADTPAAVILPKPTSPAPVRAHQAQQRADYEQAKQLQAQGWTIAAIARQLKLNRKTVRRYLQADTFPEKRRPPSQLDPYKPYILKRWNAGCRTGTVLLKAIQQQGYRGTASVVLDSITRLRQAQGLPPHSRAFSPDQQPITDPATEVLTPREAVWLVIGKPENSSDEEKTRLEKLIETNTTIAKAVDLTRDFLQPLRQRQPEQFDGWLEQAAHSDLPPFHNFVKSLRRDYGAVKAAFALRWSTGPVEGQINRLKMIKRQMYGRAKLDLLEKRFLPAA